MILTLDFKSFFYSVDIQQPMFDGFVERADKMPEKHRHIDWLKRLNLFVYRVIERYSQKLRSIHIDNESLSLKKRNVLPIGFFLSNFYPTWYLHLLIMKSLRSGTLSIMADMLMISLLLIRWKQTAKYFALREARTRKTVWTQIGSLISSSVNLAS